MFEAISTCMSINKVSNLKANYNAYTSFIYKWFDHYISEPSVFDCFINISFIHIQIFNIVL